MSATVARLSRYYFDVKLRKEGRYWTPEKRPIAGIKINYAPFGIVPNGFTCCRRVTIKGAQAYQDSIEAVGRLDNLKNARLQLLFNEYREAHLGPYPYSNAWLQEWKKYVLEHEECDSTALHTWGLPHIPDEVGD